LAQGTAKDANQSNNPLNPKPSFNIQDSYAPDLYGSDKYANDVLLRGTLPIAPVALIRVPQLIRATVPISTRPQPGGGYTTGLGDINLFDIFLTRRLAEAREQAIPWRKWGPYLSQRQWGTLCEDYTVLVSAPVTRPVGQVSPQH
jgi:hypothetical protein